MKRLFPGILLLLHWCQFATAQDSLFSIEGHLEKIKSGTIYLSIYEEEYTVIDSLIFQEGKFHFSGIIHAPSFATLTMRGRRQDFFPFYLTGDTIQISGRGDSLGLLVVKNSEINDDNRLLQQRLKNIYLWEKRNSKNVTLALKSRQWDRLDNLKEEDRMVMKKRREVIADFVKEHPHSIRAAMAILENFRYYAEADDVQRIYRHLDKDIRGSVKGRQILQLINILGKTAVGAQMPEIAQKDTAGNLRTLSSLRGQWVLINFWASWSQPCRRENLSLKAAYRQYKSKGFTIYNVSFDEDNTKWENAIIEDKLPWTQVSELNGWDNSAAQQFHIKVIPYNILINPKGKIVARNIYGADLFALLKMYL